LERERGGHRFSPDQWIDKLVTDRSATDFRDSLRDPVENLQWDCAKKLLAFGATVILENGFWGFDERMQYAFEAIVKGNSVELFYLKAPSFEGLWERVKLRNSTFPDALWHMSESDLLMCWNMIQIPTEEELKFYDSSTVIEWQETR
jgi:predicted kinase